MLVPFVKTYYTTEGNREWYKQRQLAKQHALPVIEVDKLLESQERALMNTDINSEDNSPKGSPPEKPDNKPRKNIFNDIDIDPDDPIGRE